MKARVISQTLQLAALLLLLAIPAVAAPQRHTSAFLSINGESSYLKATP